MQHKFIEKEICYTGQELSPHWIYKNHSIQCDAIVSFTGECEVKLDHMVDIADVLDNSPIYSKNMLHFIVEHFNIPLIEGVLRQRLLVGIARDKLLEAGINPTMLLRQGDDLFYKEGKLSVSIAGKSINSVLIHFGLNIDPEGAPVRAAGLKTDLGLDNIQELSEKIMKAYTREHEEILNASCKVKGIL